MATSARPSPPAERMPAVVAARAVVVAIPVCNEAARIGACLGDLIAQSRLPSAIVCLLNNCADNTQQVVGKISARAPLPIHIVERHLPAHRAHAGTARRLAMAHADRVAGGDGVLLTTDADCRISPAWIAANLAALQAGADAVCGRAVIDPVEARDIHAHLHADDALECRYAALIDMIAAQLDPDPADPPPRHTEESGASIAVWAAAFRAAGGVPAVSIGEDRAFIDALRRIDARIRHAPEISVVASGRTDGRAIGGMADAIRRRMQQQDVHTDALLEPAADAYRRFHFRARLRAAWRCGAAADELLSDLHLPASLLARALATPHFGAAWALVAERSPLITRRRVAFADLPRQIAEAERLLQSSDGVTTPETCDDVVREALS